MKRLVIIILILVVMGITLPGFAAFAQPIKTPHENPSTATGSLDKVSLLLSYARIFLIASNRQYTDALEVIEELKEIDIPDEFRNIIDRFNDLCRQLFTTLDILETILDETSNLIERNKIDEARINLDKAEIYVRDADILLEDLNLAIDTLTRRLGVFDPSVSDELREAYNRLEDSMEHLKQLLNMLVNFSVNLDERYIEIKGLLPTSLTLEINPKTVYIGDTVNASGLLQSDDEPLAGRSISIVLGEDTTVTVTCQEDGSYSGNITVPYKYQESMIAVATYEPEGIDADKYLACESPEVTLYTKFYPTMLQLSTPAIAYPGIAFNINGEIISEANNIKRTIKVILDNTQIAETTVSGQFNLELSPPEDITPGQRNLTVTVTPQERYAGVSEQRNITIALMPINIDLQTPGFIFLPKSIQFNGRIQSEMGPISDASVDLVFNNISTTAKTAYDGSFTATLDIPLDFSFIGQRELSINVEPLEPWVGHLSIQRQVVVINPIFTGLTLVTALALIIIVSRRRRIVEEKYIPQKEVIRSPTFITPEVSTIKLTGIKGRIISAYRAGLVIVEKITGVRMTADITLREFLAMVVKLLPRITRQLTELTVITESTLYSNQKPQSKTANMAEKITDDIKRELQRGA